jgi:hypothetical protein
MPIQKAFYIRLDSSGNTITRWVKEGDFTQKNQLNSISVTEYGQTLIGGALYTYPYGRSGVLILADNAVIQVLPPAKPLISATPATEACAGDTIKLEAKADGCDGCDFTWNDPTSTKSSILKVLSSGTYRVTVSNAAGTSNSDITINFNALPVKATILKDGQQLVSSANSGNQWFLDNQPIVGALEKQYLPTKSGKYTVQVTASGCKSLISEAYDFVITAIIDPIVLGQKLSIYPNPIHDNVYIVTETNALLNMQLFDIRGRTVFSAKVQKRGSNHYNISNLQNGNYVLLLTDPKTGKSTRVLILKY